MATIFASTCTITSFLALSACSPDPLTVRVEEYLSQPDGQTLYVGAGCQTLAEDRSYVGAGNDVYQLLLETRQHDLLVVVEAGAERYERSIAEQELRTGDPHQINVALPSVQTLTLIIVGGRECAPVADPN